MPIIEPDFLELTQDLDIDAFWAENAACFGFTPVKPRCPASFAQLGINRPEQLVEIAASANIQRMANNPRKTDYQTILQLLSDDDYLESSAFSD